MEEESFSDSTPDDASNGYSTAGEGAGYSDDAAVSHRPWKRARTSEAGSTVEWTSVPSFELTPPLNPQLEDWPQQSRASKPPVSPDIGMYNSYRGW